MRSNVPGAFQRTIIFAGDLVDACVYAGIKVPDDPDMEKYNKDDFPHFEIFCKFQLDQKMKWYDHWDNAEVIAEIPDSEIRSITVEQLRERGFLGV